MIEDRERRQPTQDALFARLRYGPYGPIMAEAIRGRITSTQPNEEQIAAAGALSAWLERPGPSCAIVTAPAGLGKSTLLAHFAASIAHAKGVVYTSCEARSGLNLARAALSSLVWQLSVLSRKRVRLQEHAPLEHWRDAARTLMSNREHGSLLLILDGVDEYADPSGLVSLFPDDLGAHARVVLSLSSDGSGDAQHLTRHLGLGSIPETVIDLAGAEDDRVQGVLAQRLSGRGDIGPTVWQMLGLLASAMGPLRRFDIDALTPWLDATQRSTALNVIEPLLSEVAELQWADSRVRGFFANHLTEEQRRGWDLRFVDWGRAVTARRQPIPEYLLYYAGAHVERAGARPEDLRWLIDGRLAVARLHSEGTFRGYRADLDRAWRVFTDENLRAVSWGGSVPYLGEEVRCALLERSAFPESITPHTLAALVDEGLWNIGRALYVVSHHGRDDRERGASLGALGNYLGASNPDAVWVSLLDAIMQLEEDASVLVALGAIASRLPPGPRLRAIDAVLSLPDRLATVPTVAALCAPLLPADRERLVRPLVDMVRATSGLSAERRTDLLLSLASALPPEHAPEVLLDAVLTASEISRASLFTMEEDLRRAIDSEHFTRFLATRNNEDLFQNHFILKILARALPPELLVDALEACHASLHDPDTIQCYGEVLSCMTPDWRARLLPTAVGLARKIDHPTERDHLLCHLVATCALDDDPLWDECIDLTRRAGYQRASHLKAMARASAPARRRLFLAFAPEADNIAMIECLLGMAAPEDGLQLLQNPKAFSGRRSFIPRILRRAFEKLPPSARSDGLQIAYELDMVHHVLPWLDGLEREQAIEHTRNVALARNWPGGLVLLRKYVAEAERAQLARQALALEESGPPWKLIQRLLAFAKQLDPAPRDALLAELREVLPPGERLLADTTPDMEDFVTVLGVVGAESARALVAKVFDKPWSTDPWTFANEVLRRIRLDHGTQRATLTANDRLGYRDAWAPEQPAADLAWEAFVALAQTPDQQGRRRSMLERLVPYVNRARGGAALSLILALDDPWTRGMTIWDIAPLVPGDRLDEALTALEGIKSVSWQNSATAALAKHTAESQLPRLFARAREIASSKVSDFDAAESAQLAGVLAIRAPQRAGELLEIGRSIGASTFRRLWLLEVSAGLSGPMREVVLDEVLGLARREGWPIGTLAVLADRMSASELEAAAQKELDVLATGKQQELVVAEALAKLAPHLPEKLIPGAVKIAKDMSEETYRAKSLADLAGRISDRKARFDLFVEAAAEAQGASMQYVAERLAKESPEFIYRVMRMTLEALRKEQLWKVCDAVVGIQPVLAKVGGPELVASVGHALLEVVLVRSLVSR